jgi:hypothetical protein
MKKAVVFFMAVFGLLFLSPVFAGSESNEGAETFLLMEESPIGLSFENYQMKDGWTPVVLSIGELDCLLWMDAAGRVSELRETGAHFVEPVCFIDVSTQSLRKGANNLYFDVYEQNRVRTRWRLSRGGTAGTVPKKILFRENGIDLCLGNLRLKLNHVAWDFQELSPGFFKGQFHGPMVLGHRELVIEKAKGIIYSTHGRNNRLPTGQSRTWSMNPNRPASGSIPPQERASLIALYNSTDGDNWYENWGWKTPPLAGDCFALPGTENTWRGITCDPGNTTVQSISLGSNNLNGFLPTELGNLANLQYLNLIWNQLSGSIPPELGNLANLQYLFLHSNQLSGNIPPELGNLANLQYLFLQSNQLSGNIPPELGNLTNLRYLKIHSNRLNGSIPSNLTNLTNLLNGWSNLRWNALYTNDDILRDFLNSKQWGGNWESTQTIAPENVMAVPFSTNSIAINWTPIYYTSNSGGYRVFYSTTQGGPYTYFGMTANKNASSLTVIGLNPGTTYYFVVQTMTNPHPDNLNTVDSEYSAEVSAAILPYPLILTSPNGGEVWSVGTVHNITWTSSGLSGKIRLELWKADKKVSNIAANIPIVNGNYPWLIGQYSPGTLPTGNDYRVKIITANGLYNDTSDGNFSIVNPSIK